VKGIIAGGNPPKGMGGTNFGGFLYKKMKKR
jgi:hypothetical protein